MKINALTDVRDGAKCVIIVGTHRSIPTLLDLFGEADAAEPFYEPTLTVRYAKGAERIDCKATGGSLSFVHVEDLDALRGVSLDSIYIEPAAWRQLTEADVHGLAASVVTSGRTAVIGALIGQAR